MVPVPPYLLNGLNREYFDLYRINKCMNTRLAIRNFFQCPRIDPGPPYLFRKQIIRKKSSHIFEAYLNGLKQYLRYIRKFLLYCTVNTLPNPDPNGSAYGKGSATGIRICIQ